MKKIWMENKGKLIISSLIVLVPVLAEWVMQRKIFGYSLFFLVIHWFLLSLIFRDKKNEVQSKKVVGLVFWIVPMSSLISCVVFQMTQQGTKTAFIIVLLYLCFGVMFVIMGNYLPKFQQNSTMGIRVKWALKNEENWNATHRFSGKIWVAGGFLCMICGMFPDSSAFSFVFFIIVLINSFVPFIYSYLFYRKQIKEGKAERIESNPKSAVTTSAVVLAAAGFLVWVLFSGNMTIEYDADSFTVKTGSWKNITLNYNDIENIEYQPNDVSDTVSDIRTNGFGNLRMSLGSFENEIYGNYTRYTYAGCPSCVVLTVDGETVVINGADDEATREIFDMVKESLRKK
jgi:uncharacterized membrane protein